MDKQISSALTAGCILFIITLFSASSAIALSAYYAQFELALLLPVLGVFCMWYGASLFRNLDIKNGYDVGGAGADLLRSATAAIVVVATPLLCWGTIVTLSQIMHHSMETIDFPKNSNDLMKFFSA